MENLTINPWSTTDYSDYGHLREQFGIQEFTKDQWRDIPHPPLLFRRGIVFGQRDFYRIAQAIHNKKKWAIMTGLMPSGKMHLGHKMVIDQVIYYQSLGADIFIGVADIEAYATRGYTLPETKKVALEEYITNYIALGLQPCDIYFQSQRKEVTDLGYILAKKTNWSEVTSIYGFTGATNMAHVFAPLIQCGDILHVQMKKYGGPRPTLVPVGVDQDPHIRFTRDIAQSHRLYNVTVTKDGKPGIFVKGNTDSKKLLDKAQDEVQKKGYSIKRITKYNALYILDKNVDMDGIDRALAKIEQDLEGYGFILPSSTYHRFMTGLTGEKMSSSKPQTAIFLTDTAHEAQKKIQSAKTGGAISLAEQKKYGGNPDKCVVYELFLYHLLPDDKELTEIYEKCRNGEQRCGDCKKLAIEMITKFLEELEEKRKEAWDKLDEYVSS